MIQPPFLKQGDTVGIVAPARKIDREVILKSKQILETWNLSVRLSENLFSSDHSYFSASDVSRAKDLQHMMDDPSINAIICARGGYGSTRILDALNFSELKKHPKWLVGFSDITAIHLHLYSLTLQSVHATMPILFSKDEAKSSVESLRKLLFGEPSAITAKGDFYNKVGKASGQMIGGNLSLIADSLGTRSEPDTTDRILVIEEIDEYYYKVDRMLMQLKRAGKLRLLQALVVGHFTDIKETSINFGETIKSIVQHHTREYAYPLAFNFPIGHSDPNIAWIHGAIVNLTVNEKGSEISVTKS